jgi:hypothetical protein
MLPNFYPYFSNSAFSMGFALFPLSFKSILKGHGTSLNYRHLLSHSISGSQKSQWKWVNGQASQQLIPVIPATQEAED